VAVAAALMAPGTAWAQDAGAAADTSGGPAIIVTGEREPALTQESDTGSRLGITLMQIPATVNVVDGDDIRARGDFSVQSAVSRAPGVTMSGNPGNGGTSLSMRGFNGAGSVLQLYNGVRLYPVADTVTFPTDPWNVGRIEVLSGPASVLYGQGALGGAVNVVTKAPNAERFEFQGEAGYGSQNTFHAAAGVGGPLGEVFSFRADASYRQSDGFVDRGDNDSLSLSGALQFSPSTDFNVTLRNDYGNVHPQEYFGTPLVDSELDESIRHNNYNVGDSILHFRDNRTTLDLDWTISDVLQVRNVAYYITSKRKFQNLEIYCWIGPSGDCPNGYGYGTPGNVYRSDNYGIIHDQDQYGNQASLKFSAPLGGSLTNDLLIGLDINRVKLTYSHDFGSDFQESEVPLNDFDPGTFLDTQGIAPRYRTRTDTIAVFAEDRLQITDQLSLVGGIRYEHNKVGRWNFLYSGPNGSGAITGEAPALNGGTQAYKSLDHTTWRVGAVYQPSPTLSFYAQYATAVDPLGTLTTYSTSATQYQLTNADGRQYEAGVKALFLDGAGQFTLSAYHIDKYNLFTQQIPNGPIEQVGHRSSQGIEASIDVRLPAGFAINANGSILDAKIEDDGSTPAGVPEQSANLELSWNGIEQLQVRGNLRYVGRRFTDDASEFRVPSYTVVDLSATYAITPQLGIDVRVFNLFDKAYAEGLYFDEQWILGRPQSFDVAVRAAF
jgi:iron complex outermembrane receptor protein